MAPGDRLVRMPATPRAKAQRAVTWELPSRPRPPARILEAALAPTRVTRLSNLHRPAQLQAIPQTRHRRPKNKLSSVTSPDRLAALEAISATNCTRDLGTRRPRRD